MSPDMSPDRKPSEDDTKRRFREALDRKRAQQHATEKAAEADGSSKSHGSHGPIKNREFRRKSG